MAIGFYESNHARNRVRRGFCAKLRGALPEPADVGGECAVYMMAGACNGMAGPCGNASETGPNAGFWRPANLDALPLSPYTSAVPWMNVNLDPALPSNDGRKAGMEEDFVRCRGAAN